MKRLYYLLPNLQIAETALKSLLEKGISKKDISLVANDSYQIEQLGAHEPSLAQSTDLIPSLERGALAGAVTGLLAGVGLSAFAFPALGLFVAGEAVVGLTLFGTGFGAWASSMIGVSVQNPIIEKYESAIAQGDVLLLVEVPNYREVEIRRTLEAIASLPSLEAVS